MSKSGAALRAAGWVAVGAVAAGGVATAATTSDTSKTTTAAAVASQAPATKTPAAKHKRGELIGKLRGRVLHGQFVVLGKDKKPTTLAEQRGTVDAVSPTSITLTSTDGFKQTYAVTSNTKVRVNRKKSAIGDVKTGQTAAVVATVSGSTQTAKAIVERAAK